MAVMVSQGCFREKDAGAKRLFAMPFSMVLALIVAETSAKAVDCGTIEQVEMFQTAKSAPPDASCATYLDQNAGIAISCHWAFSYRDDRATQMADTLWRLLETCRTGTRQQGDLQVNHPDSYVPKYWLGKNGTYRVSVKDKAALQQSLVFLAFEEKR